MVLATQPAHRVLAKLHVFGIQPFHDKAGNMTALPLAGSETDRVFATYDAWNRLRKVYEDDGDGQFEPSDGQGGGDALLVTYEYDATGRRIEKHTTDDAPGGAKAVDYYSKCKS